jgi:hypothetical protein
LSEVNRHSFRIFSIFILWLLIPVYGWSAENPRGADGGVDVVSVGQASVTGSNLVRAKEEALNQALKRGVEAYLIRRFGKTGMAENFRRIMGELLPQILGDIENYHILAEDQMGDDVLVLVRVGMNEGRIREQIERAGLSPRDGPPLKVLFMVASLGENQTAYWWADPGLYSNMAPVDVALHNAFQERGLRPVNRTLGVAESLLPSGARSPELSEAEAAEWGQAFSADLVIYGWLDRREEKAPSITLKVSKVAGSAQICETVETLKAGESFGPAGPSGDGLETLAARSAETLIPCISRAMAPEKQGVGRVEIVMEGLKGFNQLTEFKRFLTSELDDVKSVVETRMKYRTVTVSVVFSGDRKALLRQILGREIASLSFDLLQAEEDKIVLKVR